MELRRKKNIKEESYNYEKDQRRVLSLNPYTLIYLNPLLVY